MISHKPNPALVQLGCVAALVTALTLPMPALAACPSLQAYYPDADDQWPRIAQELSVLMPDCLDSAEFFALYGAALMNTAQIPAALEALERALLIDPANGAATIDYAEALYSAGQLFPALEINAALLERRDLPPDIANMLQSRQRFWQAQTRSRNFSAELSAGYDDNLNGAPSRSDFTLTLSGELVPLTLDPDYQPVSGGFLNFRVTGNYQRLTPERNHDLVFVLRNRISDNRDSDMAQFDWRYALTQPWKAYQWDLVAGTSHLLFGGSPLYSIGEARARLRRRGNGCQPQAELAGQYQQYHGQSLMSGFETALTGGVECQLREGSHQVSLEAGPLLNAALNSGRPGADRQGWKLQASWQFRLGLGQVNSQFSYANLKDSAGYSPLLANNARRETDIRMWRLQYGRPLQGQLLLLVNLSHQGQGSNIGPFASKGTALDVGLRLNFQ
jgi:tetratricopeptide (TPR) repeat protein